MVRSAMSKRFPGESPEAIERIAPYLYQITAAPGSGEYALSLLLEPGAWARRPLCERLLPLQGICFYCFLEFGELVYNATVLICIMQCLSPSFTAAEIGWIRSMRTNLCQCYLCRHQ
jgi:hypothetical protein